MTNLQLHSFTLTYPLCLGPYYYLLWSNTKNERPKKGLKSQKNNVKSQGCAFFQSLQNLWQILNTYFNVHICVNVSIWFIYYIEIKLKVKENLTQLNHVRRNSTPNIRMRRLCILLHTLISENLKIGGGRGKHSFFL